MCNHFHFGFRRTLLLVIALLFAGLFTLTGAAVPTYARSASTHSVKKAALPTITGSSIVAQAQSWVNAGVPYNQGGTYNGYREDCSGFVSMAWGLGTPGLVTSTLPSVSHQINKDDLQPGDVLLNADGGGNADYAHVIIFASWVDSSHTSYNGYEEVYGYPYYIGAHYTTNIPYPYWPGYDDQGYVPMRLNILDGTSTPTSSQLIFLDQTPGYQVYSIDIAGPDQDGNWTDVCWPTPDPETVISNMWWESTTYVTLYTDSNCQNYYGGGLYFNSDGASYRCLQDVDPYLDWDCNP